jgi:hypothetical protein
VIVYGDPSFTVDPRRFAAAMATLAEAVRRAAPRTRRDALRSLLILAGQLEQSIEDAGLNHATMAAATGCCYTAVWAFRNGRKKRGDVGPPLAKLAQWARALAEGDVPASLTVKVPEGFAFYALYPEQYIEAAERWVSDHPAAPNEGVTVVGLRSIGTSLSALVAQVLDGRGGNLVGRRTVRPEGHPFRRTVELPVEWVGWAHRALVVDEGPGLSGSSMAAAASALERAGIPRDRIAFFPGHGGDPGGMASDEVRRWWADTPRYVVPLSELRWDGRTLTESLADAAARFYGDPPEQWHTVDAGGGLWRAAAYGNAADWPAVCPAFERPKYRCVGPNGRAVLWKFEGMAYAERDADGDAAYMAQKRLTARAADGWCPAPLGTAFGFVAVPWVEGERLMAADARSPGVVAHIGRYIASVAGAALTPEEQAESHSRIAETLYGNTHEALGVDAAERTKGLADAARANAPPITYGDGRLAPHEWVRDSNGRLWKTDSVGHDADHTCVGRQSVAWDVAGAMVEWSLADRQRADLLTAYSQVGGPDVSAPALTFYRAAYTAFRLGMVTMAAQANTDPAEGERLSRAIEQYRTTLAQCLGL